LTCIATSPGEGFGVTRDGDYLRVNGLLIDNGGDKSNPMNYARIDNTSLIQMTGDDLANSFGIAQDISINSNMIGGGGNDTMAGGGGNDTMQGGAGDDRFYDSAGNDSYDGGGTEIDTLYAEADASFTLTNGSLAGQGNDSLANIEQVSITGGASANTIDASAFTFGNCTLSGMGGNDILRAGTSFNVLSGGDGNDQLFGSGQNDTLSGGADNDTLYGSDGNDQLSGGSGNDTLYGGKNNDLLDGGTEDDDLHGEDGMDTLLGEDGTDVLYGDQGMDSLDGGKGIDYLRGGTGNDILTGGDGGDFLYGDEDNDHLRGDFSVDDNDVLDGGSGFVEVTSNFDLNFGENDVVAFTKDTNFVVGPDQITGQGTDSITGGVEAVQITAGPGANTFTLTGFYNRILMSGLGGDDFIDFRIDVPTIRPLGGNTGGQIQFFDPNRAPTGADPKQTLWYKTGIARISTGTIDHIEINGGPGDNLVDMGNWTGKIQKVDGGAGNNTIQASRDDNMTLTNNKLTFAKGGELAFSNFNRARLIGGKSNNKIDATSFTGLVAIFGGDGNDTLIGTNADETVDGVKFDDSLYGEAGKRHNSRPGRR